MVLAVGSKRLVLLELLSLRAESSPVCTNISNSLSWGLHGQGLCHLGSLRNQGTAASDCDEFCLDVSVNDVPSLDK